MKTIYSKHLFMVVLTFFFSSSSLLKADDCVGKKKFKMRRQADYIIVGCGTAGSVLANKLSQKHSVIVLEGGINQDNNELITNPLEAGNLVLSDTNLLFWALGHTPIDNTSPVPENMRRWSGIEGELMGGGSSVNGMQDVRGTSLFFDLWQAAAGGDPAWGPANAEAVYKSIETFSGVPGQFDPTIHGNSGPLGIRQAVNNLAAANLFENAVVSLGLAPAISDYNVEDNAIGAFQYWQIFQHLDPQTQLEVRTSSSNAYLEPIIKQVSPNVFVSQNRKLQIVTKAKAQRILFDTNRKIPRAKAVLTDVDGTQTEFKANKEIIVCTGFQSALFLQLSGIGDETKLNDLGIPVVYNNPNVGQHAHNHPGIRLTGINGNIPAAPNPDPRALYDGGAFLPYPVESATDRAFELIGIASPGQGTGTFTIASLILNPLSVGFTTLYNSDPNRMPWFNFATYANPRDQAASIYIYTKMWDILTQMGFISFANGAPNPHTASTSAVLNYIQGFVGGFQNYHYQSMCIMSTSPQTGVVDHDGRVFGVKSLRVADVTILPISSRGNTSAPAFLIGNVIADKILFKKE